MSSELDGKVILQTGASSGIGAATASVLGASGAHVISHYRNDRTDRAGAERALMQTPEARKLFVPADFSDLAAVDQLWRDAVAWRGRIDVVVLNAAITMTHDGVEDNDDAAWLDAWSSQWQVN